MHSPITTFAGIDWATEESRDLRHRRVRHGTRALRGRAQRGRSAGPRPPAHGSDRVSGVAIERPDGPVVDALLAAGLEVVVIASRHVKALRTRYGQRRQQGRPCRRLHPRRRAAHRRPPPAAARARRSGHGGAARERAGAQGPRAHQGAPRAAAACPPRARVPRRGGPLRQARLTHRRGLPDTLPLGGARSLAEPAAFRGLARSSGLPGSSQRGRAACPAHRGTGGCQRRGSRLARRGDARLRAGHHRAA